MGLYDRDYYRESTPPRRSTPFGTDSSGTVVKYLIAINVIVFILQILLVRDMTPADVLGQLPPEIQQLWKNNPDFARNRWPQDEFRRNQQQAKIYIVTEWCALDPYKVIHQGQVWRLITHAFCHDRHKILHIVVNMMVLYFFGLTIESMYGSREFLLFYLASIVAAGLAYIGLELLLHQNGSAVGASGAVFAVTMLYTLHFPRNLIYIFFVIPMETRWAMALFILWDLYPVVLALNGDPMHDGVAHAAHLGGALFGFLYYRFHWRLSRPFEGFSRPQWMQKRRSSARPRLRLAPETIPEPEPTREVDGDRLDQILTKISRTGQGSLTEEELAILKRASEDLKNRRQKGEF